MSFGITAVDYESRIDFDRLRRDRLRRAVEQIRRHGLGAVVVFDYNNIRYVTSTHLGEWGRDKMERFAILTADGQVALFDPAAPFKRRWVTWLQEIHPVITHSRSTMPDEAGWADRVAELIRSTLSRFKVSDLPIGFDILDPALMHSLSKKGVRVEDGQRAMLEARLIKTGDEIELLEIAAAMVDAVYSELARYIKPGVRENDIVAYVHKLLFEMGSEGVEAVNVVSGPRGVPHPHMFSDRMIRPRDMVYIDIMHSYLGYRTCYYRTFVVGEPTKAQIEAYDKAWEWLKCSIERARPGATTAEIASCWPSAQELGFRSEEEAFLLEFGHGIGLSHRERPLISRAISFDYPVRIQENMVLALETWAPSADKTGAARIEVEVVVTDTGPRIITLFPADKLVSVPSERPY
ncbi:MAG: Xaa-Pro peptidase family protein [Desulfurococcales archaeon]|nr:Xaa-Pro peptidase family protein [Desulfurococcales archaeon]MDT7889733.1 Xaa-Pro peptidase family protein [Desulfurococcales archaeon]